MSSPLNYSEKLTDIPYDRYFTEFGNNRTVYKKILSPFNPEGFTYLSKIRNVVTSSIATPTPRGMFYLCDNIGTCLYEDISINEDTGWNL